MIEEDEEKPLDKTQIHELLISHVCFATEIERPKWGSCFYASFLAVFKLTPLHRANLFKSEIGIKSEVRKTESKKSIKQYRLWHLSYNPGIECPIN